MGQITTAEAQICLERGVEFGRQKDFQRAVEQFQQVTRLAPDSAEGYYNLGNALSHQDRLADSIRAFERAVELRPDWPEACFNLANGYRDAQQREQAIATLEKALQLRPHYDKALNNLANLYFEQGQNLLAEKLLRRALEAKPNYAEAFFNLGRVLRRLRRSREALDVTAKATELQPRNIRYRLRLAELQKGLGHPLAARKTLETILKDEPDQPDAMTELATLHHERRQHEQALTLLNQSVQRGRITVETLMLRADVLRDLKRFDEAMQDLKTVLEIDPHKAMAHNLQGVIHFAKGELHAAIPCYQRAVSLRHDIAEAHNNLGAALQAVRRYPESRAAFDAALRVRPDFSVARLNHALSMLREGDFAQGWREFEWRFHNNDYRLSFNNRPVWTGEPLEGKTLLLRSEQGLGDTFQFIRYAPLLKSRGATVVLESQPAARQLAATCPGVDRAFKRGDALPHVDLQVPLMSLPDLLGTRLETIPAQTPYLFAEPERISAWQQRLATPGKLVVGIAWQGNRKFAADHHRSLSLAHFDKVARVPGVKLVSLQKNDGIEQLEEIAFSVERFTEELDVSGPFRDTAAIIMASDVIVTSDTAIAHLAGALGKPVWVALSYAPDWRWLVDRDDCPWYPTMRLFRQTTFGKWGDVFSRIAAELKLVTQGETERLLPPSRAIRSPEVMVEMSPGELIDKITILEIKMARFTDENKRNNVRRELESLLNTRQATLVSSPELDQLTKQLSEINAQLWEIEDQIRECERQQDFGPVFIELARSVYITNDRRALVKRQINALTSARFQEEKSYTEYAPDHIAEQTT